MRVAFAEGMDQAVNRDIPGVWNQYPPVPRLAMEVITELIQPYLYLHKKYHTNEELCCYREYSSVAFRFI